MLSRSAERLYWLARYLERTENTARLISVTMNLIYDLPRGSEVGWHNLLTICGVEAEFNKHFDTASEQNITRFLLTDLNNTSSLLSSLLFARENIRISRELMPDEAWEHVNEIYLYATQHIDSVDNRRGREVFLREIMRGCQRFTGFMVGAMSRNDSYRFIVMGRNIERADMTSRIMDFGTVLLAENRSHIMREYEGIVWINILKSLSASLMYRKQIRRRIKGEEVLGFLLKNLDSPSSINHCLQEISCCVIKLPNAGALAQPLNDLEQVLLSVNIAETTPIQLRQIIDSLQTEFNSLHAKIAETWFLKDLNEQTQSQSQS